MPSCNICGLPESKDNPLINNITGVQVHKLCLEKTTCPTCGTPLKKPFSSTDAVFMPDLGLIVHEKCIFEQRRRAEAARRLTTEVSKSILLQKDEFLVNWMDGCQEFTEDRTQPFGARVGFKGFLVITNQRILFACKMGRLAKDYGLSYGINLEDVMSISQGKFGFNDKLVILEKTGQHKDFIKPQIQLLIPIINTAISERKRELQAAAAPPTYVTVPAGGITITAPVAPQPPPPGPPCPGCNQPLTYIEQYRRWYCYNCKRYA